LAVNISVYALAIIYLIQAHCSRSPTHASALFNYWRIPTAGTFPLKTRNKKPQQTFYTSLLSPSLVWSAARRPSLPTSYTPPPTTYSVLRSQPRKTPQSYISTMADIDMPDAEVGTSSKTKAPAKASKSGPSEAASDGKKRFEVKKACLPEFHPREFMF